jgi:hypothetical protein
LVLCSKLIIAQLEVLMSSDSFNRLHIEAQNIAATGSEILAGWQSGLPNKELPGISKAETIQRVGMVTFLTGMAGIAATVESYHSYLFDTVNQAESTLLGLGMIASGDVGVPVAGLVAFGASVVGATAFAVGNVMAGVDILAAHGDRDSGAGNLISGAINIVKEMIEGRPGMRAAMEEQNSRQALLQAQLPNFEFTVDAAEAVAAVKGIGPKDGTFTGIVLKVDKELGVAFQSKGCGCARVLPLKALSHEPVEGEMVKAVFKGGRGELAAVGRGHEPGIVR